jgi:hypothetical protein
MDTKADERNRSEIWFPLYGFLGAVIAFLPKIVCSIDAGHLLYLLVAVPIVTLALIFVAMRTWDASRRMAAMWLLTVYIASSLAFLVKADDIRAASRWLWLSQGYKREIIAMPTNLKGEFRHVEWDGSGFAGIANNVVYLVYDPSDSLIEAARSHASGKFDGIPCEVLRVRRLENQWYSVNFYTDTAWNSCK